MNKILSIIIPAYNESDTIVDILNKVFAVQLIGGFEKEVVIVDDYSSDTTRELIEKYQEANSSYKIDYVLHELNMGKGAAIHSGIKKVTGAYTIIQDADLEYDPADYNRMLGPIINEVADVVYGSRFTGSSAHRVLYFWHSKGNKFLTLLSNMFTNLNLTDMETCYKLFDTKILKSLSLKEKRFGFEPEVTAKLSRIPDIRIYEVGISYYGRTYKEGKKITWKDGFRAIYAILKYGLLR